MTSIRERYQQLGASQKPPKGAPAYTLYVNRAGGRLIAAASPRWITPNSLTLLHTALSYAALLLVWVLPTESPLLSFIGLALLGAYFIDSADGQLSRLRSSSSILGGWLDHVLDAGRMVLLHASVMAYFFRADPHLANLGWASAFLVSSTLIYVGGLLVDHAKAKPHVTSQSVDQLNIRSFLLLPADYGLLCCVLLFLPLLDMFSFLYSALAATNAVYAVMYMVKWTRELR